LKDLALGKGRDSAGGWFIHWSVGALINVLCIQVTLVKFQSPAKVKFSNANRYYA
jgi:hypothetical protein